MILSKLWRYFAKAIGDKASDNKKEADIVALIRAIFVILTLITEVHIILNFYFTHVWN